MKSLAAVYTSLEKGPATVCACEKRTAHDVLSVFLAEHIVMQPSPDPVRFHHVSALSQIVL